MESVITAIILIMTIRMLALVFILYQNNIFVAVIPKER